MHLLEAAAATSTSSVRTVYRTCRTALLVAGRPLRGKYQKTGQFRHVKASFGLNSLVIVWGAVKAASY